MHFRPTVRRSLTGLVLALALASCGTKQDAIQLVDSSSSPDVASADVPGGDGTTAEVVADTSTPTVSFATDIAPLMASCKPCHATKYSSYAGVKASATSINSAVQDGRMPRGAPWSQAKRDLFQSWIDAGMPK